MPALPVTALRTVACCLCLLLAGCATTREPTPGDPFETANRGIYAANVSVDRVTLRPVARVYARHTPQWVRSMVGNFFTNLSTPFTIANQILQGKPKEAAQDTLRFTMNTTLGLAGLFDPASDAGLPRHDEDLGQTLGRWGVPPGPFIMMPLLGPAHLRDIPSAIAERFATPLYWYSPGNARWISLAISAVDLRARLLPLDETLAKTYDPYAFIREAFNQRRRFQVYDGNVPEELLQEEDVGDEPDDAGEAMPEEATGEPAAEPAGPPPADEPGAPPQEG
jgi:phospholipid-binding lipoprotein MlaA